MSNKKRIAKKIQALNNRGCSVGSIKQILKILENLPCHADHAADSLKYFSDTWSMMSANFVNCINTARGRDTKIYEFYQSGIDFGSLNKKPLVPTEYKTHYDGLLEVGFDETEAFELLKETFKF